MIIYIPLEVIVRELQSHLLFGAIAASKGHQIFIASASDLWLYHRLGLIKPGVMLIKNVNVPTFSKKMYDSFLNKGFDIYCHEQEPPILYDKFENYLSVRNIHLNQFLPFKAVFCWGDRDRIGYKTFFKDESNIFVKTGSPRVDLWNKKFHEIRENDKVKKLEPYFLVISNFGSSMGSKNWTEWISVGKKNETIKSIKAEDELIDFIVEDTSIAQRMVQAARYLARTYPHFNVVIRPHPSDKIDHWINIKGDFKNLHVIDTKIPLSYWISKAKVIVQNGCTSAIESVLQGVPVISFGPKRDSGSIAIPSKVSLECQKISDLKKTIDISLNKDKYSSIQTKSEKILKEIIYTNSELASNKILEVITTRSSFNKDIRINKFDLLKIKLIRFCKGIIDLIKCKIFGLNSYEIPFEIDSLKIEDDISKISNCIKIRKNKINYINKTGFKIN